MPEPLLELEKPSCELVYAWVRQTGWVRWFQYSENELAEATGRGTRTNKAKREQGELLLPCTKLLSIKSGEGAEVRHKAVPGTKVM